MGQAGCGLPWSTLAARDRTCRPWSIRSIGIGGSGVYGPLEDGSALATANYSALDRLRRDPGLPVPTLVAHGRPAADHAYVAHPTEGR